MLGMPALVAGCLLLGVLSLLGPTEVGYDAWAWLVWGREITQGALDTAGGPSWKPLPVLFTTPLSAFGDAAPLLWLVLARAGGLLALALTWRLAARFAGHAAGAVACVALVLTPNDEADFLGNIAQGNVEPLVVALCLWAVQCHLDGRRDAALVLGFLAGLARPEIWPFLALYSAWRWRREPQRRPLVAGLVVVTGVLWFGGDWWGSGDPFTGGDRAQVVASEAAGVLGRVGDLVILPVWLLAAVGVAFAAARGSRPLLVLAGMAAGWIVVVVAMTLALDYAGLGRFFAPATALVCVLAGIGAVRLVALPAGRRVRVAVAVALVAASAPFALPRITELEHQRDETVSEAALQASLARAVDRAGGPAVVTACGGVAIDFVHIAAGPALAWYLGVPLGRVHERLGERPGVIFALTAHPRHARLAADPDLRRIGATAAWGVFAQRCPDGTGPHV